MTATTHFPKTALTFMRALRRNNDRIWFGERKSVFESEVQQPMLALCEAINAAMVDFAPEHVRPARKAVMRIYRDTRFSPDKRPYKHQISAWWSRAGMEKTSGAGYYFHFGSKELVIAAGCYMPQPDQLLAIRRSIAAEPGSLQKIFAGKKLRTLLPEFDGRPLTRAPKGFAPDDPALDLLRCRQWGVGVTLPPEEALKPTLLREILTRFRIASPLVERLNAPFVPKRKGLNTIF